MSELLCSSPGQALEGRPALLASWQALDASLREHLMTFMAQRTDAEQRGHVTVAPYGQVPATFSDDLLTDRSKLRAAFPVLRRALTSVRLHPRPTIHFTCETTHDGLWFDFMQPTHREIRYVERHTLQHRPDGEIVDVVRIDFSSIIRQLVQPAVSPV